MNGVMNKRSIDDEDMIVQIGRTANCKDNIINNSKVVIYDARPKLNAQANRLKGGGFEDIKYYRNSEIFFCDIDNIHEVSKVFQKLQDLPNTENFTSASLFS